ncbi:MAG: ABC transporter substrate-binding protein [Flavipsychrobacter sp.]|nr:ABC transporter substrate-binding protein [Flavipsychrobacter sp.]
MRQIGILLPRSGVYPTMTFDIVDGFKGALNTWGAENYELKTAGIAHGGNNKEIYTACEQLILNGASIIVGYINPSTVAALEPLMKASNTLMISLDAGYHLQSPTHQPQNTFTVSLQGTLAARITPYIAAKHGVGKFAFTCSFYDAGYRIPFGLFNGSTDNNCEIVFNHTTKLKKNEFTIEPLTTYIAHNKDTAIFSATCGDMTKELFEAAANSTAFNDVPWFASSFTAEESWLSQMPFPNTNISVIVPWGRNLDNPENEVFSSKMKEKNRAPNVFSLLGWEAGQIIAEALKHTELSAQIAALKESTFSTPRGSLRFHPDTLEAIMPMYEGTIVRNENSGTCRLALSDAIPDDIVRMNYEKLRTESALLEDGNTSWFNSYGCLD